MSSHPPLACVTGASSGIGATFARKLAARGYHLLLVARRKERLDELAREIGSAEVMPADLTDEQQLRAVEERLRGAGNLEFLVNNAGFGSTGRFFEAPIDGPDAMHRLHILATVRLTHAALPGMVLRRKGAIINVSSVAGFWIMPGSASYCSTKAWMNAFTEAIYLELKQAGSPVRIQALCPGFTYSEFHDVAQMDRNLIPKDWWMPADFVVEESLKALDKNKLYAVPARKYKAIVWLSQVLPRSWRQRLALRAPHRRQRQP